MFESMLIAKSIWKFLSCLLPVSVQLQKFRDRLQSLLEVGGAEIVSIKAFCSSSQVCNSCSLYIDFFGSEIWKLIVVRIYYFIFSDIYLEFLLIQG
jgi:hypothetical protein